MHQITWFWPQKLKNLPTVGGGPSPRSVASLPRICSQNIFCVFLEVRNHPPPPPHIYIHFWRPVYATVKITVVHIHILNFVLFISQLVWSNISQPPIILRPTAIQARFNVGSIMFLEITFVQWHTQLWYYIDHFMCILFTCLYFILCTRIVLVKMYFHWEIWK